MTHVGKLSQLHSAVGAHHANESPGDRLVPFRSRYIDAYTNASQSSVMRSKSAKRTPRI